MKSINLNLKHDISEYGIVEFSLHCLSMFISSNRKIATSAIHGIKNIEIVDFYRIVGDNVVAFLIHSRDIPEYVAFHEIMEDLQYIELYDYNFPKIDLLFQDIRFEQDCSIQPEE